MFTKNRAQWSLRALMSMANLKRFFGIAKQEKEETLPNSTADFLFPEYPETESFSIDSELKPLQTDNKLSLSDNSHCYTSMVPFDQTWKIDHFCCLSSDNLNQSHYRIESLSFGPANNDRVKFRLVVYPHGCELLPDFVTLYLLVESIDYGQPIQVIYNFSIIDANGEKQNTKGSNVTTLTDQDEGFHFGFLQYIPRQTILCPNSGLLINDSLTIYCQINQLVTKSVMPDLFKVDYSFPENEFFAKCAHLWGDKTYSDVILVIIDRDGLTLKQFQAHKLILAAQSPVFADMFSCGMIEQVQNRVEIVDIQLEVFEQLLKFIYLRDYGTLNEAFASELMVAADKYQMDSLKSICEQYLCSQVSFASARNLLALAQLYGANRLKAKANEYIRKFVHDEFVTLMEFPEFALNAFDYLTS